MKARINLIHEKLSERQTREHIEKAAEHMKNIHQKRGDGDVSYERVREKMQEQAEKDNRKGKI